MGSDWNEDQKERTLKFLVFDYFKFTADKKTDVEKMCAERAYLDMCRTLSFVDSVKGNGKKAQKIKRDFRSKIIKEILAGIRDLRDCNQDNYDVKHKQICSNIVDIINNIYYQDVLKEQFCYGQAQKWLNMTIKYMWLLGLWDSKLEPFTHVPLDNYIIAEVKKIKGLEKPLPKKAWSKWDKNDIGAYNNIQTLIRDYANAKTPSQTPLVWEYDAWLKQSMNAKGE